MLSLLKIVSGRLKIFPALGSISQLIDQLLEYIHRLASKRTSQNYRVNIGSPRLLSTQRQIEKLPTFFLANLILPSTERPLTTPPPLSIESKSQQGDFQEIGPNLIII